MSRYRFRTSVCFYRSTAVLLSVLVWSLIGCVSCDDSAPPAAGHMKPLGSHMPPLLVETIDTFPHPLAFHSNYVERNRPVIFKGLIRETDAFKNWRSDEYLKNKYGDITVGVETQKKENRSQPLDASTLREFLNSYNTSDIYMVCDMHEDMKEEWPLPSFLLCGGYTENLAFMNVWFSSGGTKSVLHSDNMENLHCVVSGRKEFIMFEPQYSVDIGPEHQSLGYYHIDVETVNMTQYPNISTLPWYRAVVNEGDCLYLPYQWLHHVHSYGRNMGVNVWWIPFEFNREECETIEHIPGFAHISQFPMSPGLQIKQFLLEIKRSDGSIHATDMYETQKEAAPFLTQALVNQLFETLVPGCDGVLNELDLRGDKIPFNRFAEAQELVSSIMKVAQGHYDDNEAPPLPDYPPPTSDEYYSRRENNDHSKHEL